MPYSAKYDIIVIGAGHAGIEAALVAARMGCNVLLLTLNIDTIGQMSCNPSVGGLAKGHLVKEIDALGGEIGVMADTTAIQFRMLNRSKGPAVWSPRTQNDRWQYKTVARRNLEKEKNIVIKQEEVSDIVTDKKTAVGVRTTAGNEYLASGIVLTTGTFMNGLMHIGFNTLRGGRLGEAESSLLSESLKNIGFNLGRLKTGTSPRIAKNSVDLADLRVQPGDNPALPFSFRSQQQTTEKEQVPCYITHTNEATHKIIQGNIDRSPLYTGKITGIGPRYCPSIETKVVRFEDRNSHIVFIEPEGIDAAEYYLNGLSTSLPYDVQVEILHTIKGLEHTEITRPGYAVEYDFLYPIQLYPTLETKLSRNLYCAGQINGTSGYEEAAAQGLMAGINAVLKQRNMPPFILKRHEAYIGVLIDDLVTKNTLEPYRMFTSLAEHRLVLRIDNVADRLMHYGAALGLISGPDLNNVKQEREMTDRAIEKLKNTTVRLEIANPILKRKNEREISPEQGSQSLFQLLKRPNLDWYDINQIENLQFPDSIGNKAEIEVKYDGYIRREEEAIKKLSELEREPLPVDFCYDDVPGLSNEARSKLNEVKPLSLDQALRIQGISPTDILALLVQLRRKDRKAT